MVVARPNAKAGERAGDRTLLTRLTRVLQLTNELQDNIFGYEEKAAGEGGDRTRDRSPPRVCRPRRFPWRFSAAPPALAWRLARATHTQRLHGPVATQIWTCRLYQLGIQISASE